MSTPSHWLTIEGSGIVLAPFLQFQADLLPTQPTFDREVRPGVNGIGIWSTGTRGIPFAAETTIDVASASDAYATFALYRSMVLSKKDLYYVGLYWGTVMIQGVALRRIRRMATTVGGINVASSSGSYLVQAAWQLETLV